MWNDKVEKLTKQFYRPKNFAQKKLRKLQQSKEETNIHDRRQEGYCYGCSKIEFVSATLVDICLECAKKRDSKMILVINKKNPYGYCFFCSKYTFYVAQINARFCLKCTQKIRDAHKWLRQNGGMQNIDPFWIHIKKKFGKDWQYQMNNPDTSIRR